MAKIILLRGNSGSGKTTIGKALQRKFGRGTFLISQDIVRREMLFTKDEPNNKAIDLLENLVYFGYKNCDVVILEGILYAEQYDKVFRFIQDAYSDQIYAYYFDLPFRETLRRHKQKPNSHEFGEREMRGWWKEKDYLRDISEKKLNQDMSLDTIVDLIYNDVIKP